MGCRQGGLAEEANAAAVSDVLLLTTMCIVGLPVDVHVKDGSIYSGIFHTASVDDNNYAIVLKKAMMIKKGSREANVTRGNVIETLMILSEDLAQVVAKGITHPTDHITGYVKGDDGGAVVDDIHSAEDVEREVESLKPNEPNRIRTQESKNNGLTENGEIPVVHKGQILQEVPRSNTHLHVCKSQSNAESTANVCSDSPIVSFEQNINEQHSIENNQSAATPLSRALKDGTSVSDVKSSKVHPDSSHVQHDLVPPRNSICNKAAKESKLNPGAKIFHPSLSNQRAVNPPAMPTMAYVPECCNTVPVATAGPELEISPFAPPRSSFPIKLIQCNNIVAGNSNIDVQYVQPGFGYAGNRTVPTRYTSQYHQLPAGTGYMHPNSENVMVGRLGPVVYVHPVSHGVVQNAPVLSQVPSCPLLNPFQAHLTKHQGNAVTQTLPLCVAPPYIAATQQAYTIPSQVPLSHPSFPVIRPMQVPWSNGYFGPKYA
ncbi:unnamed protein product [Cuscuta campestris]|uniref:Ataxin 2 SM domain-containing protein n=1 Tax=Cuscuta campestris TaxID=132261 RepID=A0A484K744_9ASTE|nr:unnamed protein product [Cuscuta campestris]